MGLKIKINEKKVEVSPGRNLLEAILGSGIYVPHICYVPGVGGTGSCGLCLVEVKGKGIVKACETEAEDGMEVITDSLDIRKKRIEAFRMFLSMTRHPTVCLLCPYREECTGPENCKKGVEVKYGCKVCPMDGRCSIQEVASFLGITEEELPPYESRDLPVLEEPFFLRDYNYCVLCGRCVVVCKDVRKEGVSSVFMEVLEKGGKINIPSLLGDGCKSCGRCVDVCPTGALKVPWEEVTDKVVETVCPYCGVGCGIEVGVKDGKVVWVRGDEESPVNGGELCVKGRFAITFVDSPERLKTPLIRDGGSFRASNWDEAIEVVAKGLSKFKESCAVLSSAKCTNEENYLLQKFARVVLETNNVDHCARLCHSSTGDALSMSLGGSAMTNSISCLMFSKTIMVTGSNTTENHPIIGLRIKEAKERGANLIVVNPMRIELCDIADLWLRIRPGTDTALMSAMCKIIYDEGLWDREFVERFCHGFDGFVEFLESLDLKELSEITGVELGLIKEAARLYATEKPSSILFAMGITQHVGGVDNVLSVANLAMLTGNLGKRGSGVNPLRGQNNVQGACDMGALPNLLPGYVKVADDAGRSRFESAWGAEISSVPGLTVVEMFKAALDGHIKAMYIVGENPVISDPDSSKVIEALKRMDFVVVQDIFLSDTAKLADVVLPAASFAEKDGTFTSTERRVQRVRAFKSPPGDARPDWEIVCEVAKAMGWGRAFSYRSPEDVFSEIRSLVPSYAGITYGRLDAGGIQWPCPDENHPGTEFLFEGGFPPGKPLFHRVPTISGDEFPGDGYPFLLTTGRSLFHFHTSTMTGVVDGVKKVPHGRFLEVSYEDARELGLSDGDVVRVSSRRGSLDAKVKISDRVSKGILFSTFHFSDLPINRLTSSDRLDPTAKIPGFKVTAVRLEKLRG